LKFFSGFCLKGESELFDKYLSDTKNCVAGFSYGAIKAFEYVYNSNPKIERLILISPAFFQDKNSRYKELQLRAFNKDKERYIKKLFKDISQDLDMSKYKNCCTKEQLTKLLYYNWDIKKIKTVLERGIKIEVILGENDKVINASNAKDFFSPLVDTKFIKEANHLIS